MPKYVSKIKHSKPTKKTEKSIDKSANKSHPRSYRLDTEILNILQSTLERANKISPKKVSETRLIKALIILSSDIEDEKIIKALKEVW